MLVQIEDLAGETEQANLPGTTDAHPNWRRRLGPDPRTDHRGRRAAPARRADRRRPPALGREMSSGRADAPPIRATYRLQFHRGFTFRDATRLVPYLADLGVSHVYASPITEARPGSTHGYDIIDHNRLNPEIGSDAGFRRIHGGAARPRHGADRRLRPEPYGDRRRQCLVARRARMGPAFAVCRISSTSTGILRAPILKAACCCLSLGDQYGVILEKGEIELRFDPAEGSFSAGYFEHRFPISPRSYAGDPRRRRRPARRVLRVISRHSRSCRSRRRGSARPS